MNNDYFHHITDMLLGLGVSYTILLGKTGTKGIDVNYTRMLTLLYATLTISLVSTLIFFMFTKFRSKRFYGIYLIGLYVAYLVIAILMESELI